METGTVQNQSMISNYVAVAYYRYSSASQSEASIDIQRKYVQEYAQREGIPIIHEYVDEAMTGTNANRPAFQQMIYDSAKRAFNLVLIYADSRFGRNALDVLSYTHQLSLNGVGVFSVTEQYNTDTPSGNLMHMLQVAINENYSKELKQKIIRGNHQALEQGRAIGHPHIGYIINSEKHYELDPATSDIVKEMFNHYAHDNYSILDCINFLNAKGIKNRRGNPFKRHSVREILSNPFYVGRYIVAGIDYGNCVPRLIDDETFEKVQKRLGTNKTMPAQSTNKHTELYYLSTKLYCECGCHMVGVSGHNHSGDVYRYYSCPASRGSGKTCQCKPIPKELLEDAVQQYATSLFTDEFIQDIAKRVAAQSAAATSNALLAEKKKALRVTETRINNLVDILENHGYDADVSERLDKRKKEKATLENEIKELSLTSSPLNEEDIIAFLSQFKDYNTVDESMRALVLNVLINRITVFYDGSQLRLTITYNCSIHGGDGHEKGEPSSFDEGSPYSYYGGADGSRTRVQE